MTGLLYGEEIMIIGRTMWTQSTSVTDGRTDRITITKTVQRIASHGKKHTVTLQDFSENISLKSVTVTVGLTVLHGGSGQTKHGAYECVCVEGDCPGRLLARG